MNGLEYITSTVLIINIIVTAIHLVYEFIEYRERKNIEREKIGIERQRLQLMKEKNKIENQKTQMSMIFETFPKMKEPLSKIGYENIGDLVKYFKGITKSLGKVKKSDDDVSNLD